MTHWQQLVITLQQHEAETLATWLEDHALAVTISDAGAEPLYQQQPCETPLWQLVTIEALFSATDDLAELINIIRATFSPLISLYVTQLAEQDWVRLTQSQFPPQYIANRLWIIPSWSDASLCFQGNAVSAQATHIVRIDPGLAFGTGTHATTALCLQWLATQNLDGKTVIDFGCGSGILGLAALALHAAEVWCIDHDPQALIATRNNAELNDYVTIDNLHILSTDTLPPPAVVVVANILAKPLCELANTLTGLVANGGYLVLSGILITEADAVLPHYLPNFILEAKTQREEWACLVLNKLTGL